jgi:hypothetical protein
MTGHRSRPVGLAGALLAIAGVVLAVQAHRAGSLFRYQLAGYIAGSCLCLPLLIWCCPPRVRRLGKKLAFAAAPLLAALLLLELGIRVFGPAAVPKGAIRPDPRLGHVMVPGTDGTDALGFRNAAVPSQLDVLFVGDSQMWGYQVDGDATMAPAFARATGTATYQMSNGGYGPVQYVELVRQGLRWTPKAVIVGIYFGNDVFDAADYTGLVAADALATPGRPTRHRREPELDGDFAPNWTMALVDRALQSSRVLNSAARVLKSRLQGGKLDAQPGAVPFADPKVPTVLMPAYRLPTIDPSIDMVRDGLLVTGRALLAIQQQCRAANIRLLVLLIPTKEAAYADWQQGVGRPLAQLDKVATAEAAARGAVLAAAAGANIDVRDLLPDCVRALAAGTPLWPVGSDGHLNHHGHALAAAVAAQWWRHL